MIVFLKVIIIIAALGVAVLLSLKFRDGKDGIEVGARSKGILAGIMLFLLSIGLVLSLGQINSGHRGVVLQFGRVTDRTLGEGLYFVKPFLNSVVAMDVQTHAYEAPAEAASKDLQDVNTKVTLNYYLDTKKVNEVYRNLRQDYLERIVKPAVQESVKATTAKFNAEELITERPTVKNQIETALRDRLAQHGIIMETLSITDFKFSEEFTRAIEAKVSAAQKALEAKNKLDQVKVEAEQAAAEAKGKADAAIVNAEGYKQSKILEAEGDAQATLTRAEAQAEANEMVNKTLTDDIIRYALVQKLGDDIKVVVLPSGQEFILGPEVLGGK